MSGRVALLVVILLASSGAARAADPPTAQQHFEVAERLFAMGKFDQALIEYQAAYDAEQLPELLFNIGQCYRNLGRTDEAIFTFERYLVEAPDAPNHMAVIELVRELRVERAALPPEPEPLVIEAAPPPAPHPRPLYRRWWTWATAGAIAVAAVTTVVLITRDDRPPVDLGYVMFAW